MRTALSILDDLSYYLTITILAGLYTAPFIWSLFT